MHGIWNILKYRTIILPVVLYGCQAWSLILRKKHRLRLFENRVLRKIFDPKRDEVIGEWRRLHNKGLYDLYTSPKIIPVIKSQRIRWARHVACMGARRSAYRVLVVRPDGKHPLRRHKRRGRIILKWVFKKWGGEISIGLIWLNMDSWQTHANAVMNLWVPQNAGNF